MNVELRQIRHAVAVARHGSFARAAAELQLSQSALSRSVQALELQIGTPIFLRSANGVLTTDVGRLFLERGQALMGMADRFEAQVLRNRTLQRGRLVVGAGPVAIESCVADATSRLVGQFPLVTVDLRSASILDLPQQSRGLEYDVLVTGGHLFDGDDGVDIETLERQPTVLVCRAGHPLAEHRGLGLADAFEYPFVATGQIPTTTYETLLDAQQACPSPLGRQRALPGVQLVSPAVGRRIVISSDALMPLPAAMAQADVEAGTLVPLMMLGTLATHTAIVRLKSRARSPIAEIFCEHLREANARQAADGQRLVDTWFR